ncbi:conserved hypothetical protein [Echinococcus multilocularis]|uniref:Uncharacterized protein n=1 Tax=Echinococcus multilocularis TaxID=6211 RepID=A0A068XY66_ECHMU|nr:conserved hypothetical protein [Echinococcus multilocularis]
MSSQEEPQAEVPVEASIKPGSPMAYGNCKVNLVGSSQELTSRDNTATKHETHCANQTDHIANDNYSQCSSCQEFTTLFPFSYNIFIPATDSSVHQFMKLRHKLTTTYLRCRLRMGVNTFDSGCIYGNERLLRVESQTEEELIQAIDRLDEVIPAWKVWQRGKVDSQLIR